MRFSKEEMKKVKRLYRNMPWRIAKKHLCLIPGDKLLYGVDLKPGDLISTCKGWNEPIAEITPDWRRIPSRSETRDFRDVGKGMYVVDFDIITVSGSGHSLYHCCTFPLETREQIVAYWMREDEAWVKQQITWYGGGEEGLAKYKASFGYAVLEALKKGEEVFLPDGQLNKEWNESRSILTNG